MRDVWGARQDHSDIASRQILLKLNSLVKGDKHLKASILGQRQPLSVRLAGPTSLRHREAIVPGEMDLKFSRKALVQQDFLHS